MWSSLFTPVSALNNTSALLSSFTLTKAWLVFTGVGLTLAGVGLVGGFFVPSVNNVGLLLSCGL
jgi:hypothetical protein